MARGMIPGHPAFGSRVDLPPPGKRPECCGTAAWDRHPLAASTLLEPEGAAGSKREAAASGQRRSGR